MKCGSTYCVGWVRRGWRVVGSWVELVVVTGELLWTS